MLKVVTEIHKRLVNNQLYLLCLAPCQQFLQACHTDEVARRIVGIDKQQTRDALACIEGDQIIFRVFQVTVIRLESNDILLLQTMGIFLKRRIDNTYLTC